MTLPTIDQARSWRGLTLVATDDQPVGKIEAIYVDRTTRQPRAGVVYTGLFGNARTFVPLANAAQRGDTVQVPHQTSVVREGPPAGTRHRAVRGRRGRLYAHYGIQDTTELLRSSRLEADVPPAGGPRGGQATRKAVQAGQQAAASGRVAVHKASREVAAVVAAIETTPESKRKARKRARVRKRAMAAAARRRRGR